MRAILLIPASAALALAACGSGTTDTAPTDAASDMSLMDDATAVADAPVTAEDAAAPKGAQAFAESMANGDMFEIESSKLAATMSKNQAVKDFAAMMVKDHTASSARLKAATAGMTPAVTLAPMLDTMQQADLAALKGAGDTFDKLYVEKQVAAHEKALALLTAYASTGDAPALKDFAAKTAPVVEGHLKMVRAMKP